MASKGPKKKKKRFRARSERQLLIQLQNFMIELFFFIWNFCGTFQVQHSLKGILRHHQKNWKAYLNTYKKNNGFDKEKEVLFFL